jgi:hypothetical protein
MIRALILAAGLSSAFWWTRNPALQTVPLPPPSRTGWRHHDVSGFKLSLGKRNLVLPQGTEILIPYEVTGQDTIPDWTKV